MTAMSCQSPTAHRLMDVQTFKAHACELCLVPVAMMQYIMGQLADVQRTDQTGRRSVVVLANVDRPLLQTLKALFILRLIRMTGTDRSTLPAKKSALAFIEARPTHASLSYQVRKSARPCPPRDSEPPASHLRATNPRDRVIYLTSYPENPLDSQVRPGARQHHILITTSLLLTQQTRT